MIRARELAEGVTQFTMARRVAGRDLYRVAAYVVDGILVDTGMAHTARELVEALGTYEIDAIVNTHAHEDHFGANRVLQEERDLPVLAHALALPVLADPRRLKLHLYQRFFFGYPAPSKGEEIGEVVGSARGTFRVVPTPGHSPDHLSFLDESRGWIFCGDAYIGGRERVLREDYDVWQMIATYERLRRLDIEKMCTGSGAIVDHPRERLGKKIAYLRGMGERVMELHREGLNPKQIARRLFPGDRLVRWVTTGHFSALNLVEAFLHVPGIQVSMM
ncbi:MAG: MBL fold metallo-hydrolase [Acidobacteria bacterium]|nr:MBL fold metallo-hydrolase [Acidobacteriota bacterium]